MDKRIRFFNWMLITPLPILWATGEFSSGNPGLYATLGLIFGGLGYAFWTTLTLLLSLKIGWPAYRNWILVAPMTVALINIPILALVAGDSSGPAIRVWLLAAPWIVGAGYIFIGAWFLGWKFLKRHSKR